MRILTKKYLALGCCLMVMPLGILAQEESSLEKTDQLVFTGGIQHESLIPTTDVDGTVPRPDWAKMQHLNNTYVDLGLRWDRRDSNKIGFTGMNAVARLECTRWPLPGYEHDFSGYDPANYMPDLKQNYKFGNGYGISHLHIGAEFRWGRITLGDVYGQFGSGLILRLYEERSLGVDNALRGGKIEVNPYKGISLTLLGGKQRRYWNAYADGAWGFNYRQDAALGANLELSIEQWSPKMQEAGANLTLGGSYVSKYQANDTIPSQTVTDPETGYLYNYAWNFPRWVGAGDVRAQFQMKGWSALVEYAYKANDPGALNGYGNYNPGDALMLSLSYSQKGMSIIGQMKHSENMSFRSDRKLNGTAGTLNHLPAFANQHTYALAALYPYATQMATGEWAFQGELRYTWKRGTKMGGKYGTTLKLNASHIRGLGEKGGWTMNTGKEGVYYTDVNLELNKKITKQWTLNAMLMYQTYNRSVVELHEGLLRNGIGVVDVKYAVNSDVQMRAELQYLYSKTGEGQWLFGLYELSLFKQLSIYGQYMYNIGGTEEAAAKEKRDRHFYTVGATYSKNAHRLMLAYTKTREGYNCSGGVCRLVPAQEGVNLTYNFTW